MTDAQLVDGYLEELGWRRRSPNTIKIRKTYLKKLSRDLGPFGTIKSKELKKWLADPKRARGKGLEASSQAMLLSTIHGFYEWALREKKLKKDPTSKIEKPATKKGEPHPITEESLEKALANADGLMKCWLSLGARAGLRCQEIALISREDIHDDQTMRIFVAHGKGNKTRWLALNYALLEVLYDFGLPESGRLWDVTPQQMSKLISAYLHEQKAVRSDGLSATAHSLRHRYATQLYRISRDLLAVAGAMGHSSPSTTAGYAAADTSGMAEWSEQL